MEEESDPIMEIKVMSCKDLKAFNFFQKLNVYVIVSILNEDPNNNNNNNKQKSNHLQQKTPIDREGDGNPEWNHEMKFNLNSIKSSSVAVGDRNHLFLEFSLLSEGTILGDKTIGKVRVPILDLIRDFNGGVRFVSYQVRSLDGIANGVLNFCYSVKDNGGRMMKMGGSPPSSSPSQAADISAIYPPLENSRPADMIYPPLENSIPFESSGIHSVVYPPTLPPVQVSRPPSESGIYYPAIEMDSPNSNGMVSYPPVPQSEEQVVNYPPPGPAQQEAASPLYYSPQAQGYYNYNYYYPDQPQSPFHQPQSPFHYPSTQTPQSPLHYPPSPFHHQPTPPPPQVDPYRGNYRYPNPYNVVPAAHTGW